MTSKTEFHGDDITEDDNAMYLVGSAITAIHTHHQLALWREVYVAHLTNAMKWDEEAEARATAAAANAVAAMVDFSEDVDAAGDEEEES
jgi:hypothetical protein